MHESGTKNKLHKKLIFIFIFPLVVLTITCGKVSTALEQSPSTTPTLTRTIIPTHISSFLPSDQTTQLSTQIQDTPPEFEFWQNPVQQGIITSRLGFNWGGENICQPDYAGIEISTPASDIFAARSGIIYRMEYDLEYGNMISILHTKNLISHYLHLDSFEPSIYKTWIESGGVVYVERGQVLGQTGHSGVTGKYHPGGKISTPIPPDRVLFIIVDDLHFVDPLELIPGGYQNGVCYEGNCLLCGSPFCCDAEIPQNPKFTGFADPFASAIPTPTSTFTMTPTATFTPTVTYTITPTFTPSLTPTITETPTFTPLIPAATIIIPSATKPATTPTLPPRCGALCADGTTSTATGGGACSYHGGVADWLYVGDPRCP